MSIATGAAEAGSVHLEAEILIGIGDIHGHYPALRELREGLQESYGIFTDHNSLHLKPGAHMVFTGDYFDRGSSNLEVMHELMQLKRNNPHNVNQLFGNHELMALAGLGIARELADSDGNHMLAAYRSSSLHGMNGGDAFIRGFGETEKDAFVNYTGSLSRKSGIGRWLRDLEPFSLLRVHDRSILFVHGGVPHDITGRQDLQAYSEQFTGHIAAATRGSRQKYANHPLVDGHSIFWDRRIPRGELDEAGVQELKAGLKVDYIVIGHTPRKRITNYYGAVFDIDVGMTPRCGGNEPGAIVFKRGGAFAFYPRSGEEKLVDYASR